MAAGNVWRDELGHPNQPGDSNDLNDLDDPHVTNAGHTEAPAPGES